MAKIYCFGNTENGELGLGGIEEDHILIPRKQRLPHDRRKFSLVQLASGRNHTLLLLRNIGHERNEVFSCKSIEFYLFFKFYFRFQFRWLKRTAAIGPSWLMEETGSS